MNGGSASQGASSQSNGQSTNPTESTGGSNWSSSSSSSSSNTAGSGGEEGHHGVAGGDEGHHCLHHNIFKCINHTVPGQSSASQSGSTSTTFPSQSGDDIPSDGSNPSTTSTQDTQTGSGGSSTSSTVIGTGSITDTEGIISSNENNQIADGSLVSSTSVGESEHDTDGIPFITSFL